jgi:hypothetical protein
MVALPNPEERLHSRAFPRMSRRRNLLAADASRRQISEKLARTHVRGYGLESPPITTP